MKQEAEFGTKEFNDLASDYFGGKPKQETLEEAFEKNAEYLDDFENKNTYEYGFRDGAKWQQERSYSEEDMKQFALKCVITYTFNKNFISDNFRIPIERNNNNQFEQFKKK